jgi:hypothetical protein
MKMMKAITKCSLILLALCHQASAEAYFQTEAEMIRSAEVIAVISITDLRDSDVKGRTWTYRKSGEAKVETILKGQIPKAFTMYGAETFKCASCPIAEGRFLAFLKKDGDLWTGSNWHLSLRPIKGANVLWYIADDNRYEMKSTPLDAVLIRIKEAIANKTEQADR